MDKQYFTKLSLILPSIGNLVKIFVIFIYIFKELTFTFLPLYFHFAYGSVEVELKSTRGLLPPIQRPEQGQMQTDFSRDLRCGSSTLRVRRVCAPAAFLAHWFPRSSCSSFSVSSGSREKYNTGKTCCGCSRQMAPLECRTSAPASTSQTHEVSSSLVAGTACPRGVEEPCLQSSGR